MSSIIQGYTYDIFISYRQKDNKGDRWVSEFVDALKIELESTFKEEIDVYFDINPHDGLLETNDVEASLREKLKCLVFIPVISRTYCDPKSFAWEHEFLAFIETASADHFGLKIALPNGNVTCRVLPVRIHDLDTADIKLCETALGGILRGVDFVYRSAGVNRPLLVNEAHPNDNLNKTYYRDQINKVANAIRDIINSIRGGYEYNYSKSQERTGASGGRIKVNPKRINREILSKHLLRKSMLIIVPVLLCLAGLLLYNHSQLSASEEKTIAVIPMTNPPNDYSLAQYAVGSMDAIITKLQEIKSLTVRGGLTSLQYLDTKKSISELRKELKTNYLVELRISRVGKEVKMWIGVTKTRPNKELWANQYSIEEEQLMPFFTRIVQIIARNIDVPSTGQEILNIEKNLTNKPEAYISYLSGNVRLFSAMGNKFLDSASFGSAIKMYDRAIQADPGFARAYARRAIALSWGIHSGEVSASNISKCWSDILNASRLDKDLTDVQIAMGFYYYYCTKDYLNALISFNTASVKDPGDYQPLFYMAMVYRAMGDWEKAHSMIDRVIKFNPQEPLYLTNIGSTFQYLHNYDSALIYYQYAIKIRPEWIPSYLNKIECTILKYGTTVMANALLDSLMPLTNEKFIEEKISLDLYDGKYQEALKYAENSGYDDFKYKGLKFYYLGKICMAQNKIKEANRYFETSVNDFNQELASNNSDPFIHGYLGLAYAGSGNREFALKEGKKAIELARDEKNNMTESDMITNLAEIYVSLGLFDDAMFNIEYSLKNPSVFSTKLLLIDPSWRPVLKRNELNAIIRKYDQN